MTKPASNNKTACKQYTPEFRDEALKLACDALQMALWRRKCPENVIVHTDRGGQYCSADYQTLLKRYNLRGSMSAKGCVSIPVLVPRTF